MSFGVRVIPRCRNPATTGFGRRPVLPGMVMCQRILHAVVAFVIVTFASQLATIAISAAEDYPSRPITMVVPFAAGGPTDTLARIVSERMKSALGQPIIVENVTGAGGTIGVGRVARAAPDGYTLGIGAWNTHVVNGAIYSLAYDVLNDFEPVAQLANNHSLVVSKNAVPANNLHELIAWIRKHQDSVSAGTAGLGASTHVAGVFFQRLTNTQFQFVPYRGAAPALQDLMAGQIDLMFDQVSSSLQHVRSGKIRAYAIASDTRSPGAPEIPTTAQAGLPGFQISVWHGLWLPRRTPQTIVSKLNAAVVGALTDPSVVMRLADIGQEIPPLDQLTPKALGAYHKSEIEKWWPMIKAANIKAE